MLVPDIIVVVNELSTMGRERRRADLHRVVVDVQRRRGTVVMDTGPWRAEIWEQLVTREDVQVRATCVTGRWHRIGTLRRSHATTLAELQLLRRRRCACPVVARMSRRQRPVLRGAFLLSMKIRECQFFVLGWTFRPTLTNLRTATTSTRRTDAGVFLLGVVVGLGDLGRASRDRCSSTWSWTVAGFIICLLFLLVKDGTCGTLSGTNVEAFTECLTGLGFGLLIPDVVQLTSLLILLEESSTTFADDKDDGACQQGLFLPSGQEVDGLEFLHEFPEPAVPDLRIRSSATSTQDVVTVDVGRTVTDRFGRRWCDRFQGRVGNVKVDLCGSRGQEHTGLVILLPAVMMVAVVGVRTVMVVTVRVVRAVRAVLVGRVPVMVRVMVPFVLIVRAGAAVPTSVVVTTVG